MHDTLRGGSNFLVADVPILQLHGCMESYIHLTASIKSRSSRAHVWSSLERQTFHSVEKSSGNEAMSGGGSMQVHRQFVGLGTGGSL